MSIMTDHAGSRLGIAAGNFSVSALVCLLHRTLQRQQERKVLARIESHYLADMGITREQAMAEAAKPFWVR